MIVVVHPSLPVKNVKELVALAKKRPGELNYGSSGTGGSNHLATELFAQAAGVRIVHVPYKSIGPAITDIKGLGIAATQRSSFAPDIPTVVESGVQYVSELWWGLAAPGRTSPEIVNRLSDALRKAMQTPQLKEQYAREGGEPMPMTPQDFQKYVFEEVNRWRRVVKDAGLTLE
jgi:tripartite-type tricarboxylate transporter receptor subunit TctC